MTTLPTPARITLRVNGLAKELDILPWTTLLDALREYLDLTGTKRAVTMGSAERARFW